MSANLMSSSVSKFAVFNICICVGSLLLGLASSASAGIIPVGNDYEVSYQFNMSGIPRNGADIQNTFIFEWDDSGNSNVDYAYTIAGRGSTNISHIIDFEPTTAFLIGYGLGIPNVGDGKDHILTFVNSSFAHDVVGLKWSKVFPGVFPEPRIGHNAMISLLIDAVAGDSFALTKLANFANSEAYPAAFDPAGNFRVVEWSEAFIPEPTSLALMGLGLAGIGYRRRRKVSSS